MEFALAPEAVAAGYDLARFATIGSTNAEAMARARAGDVGPLWVVSGHQSQGRGRRGAPWQTEPGNLAASLLITLDLPPTILANLGFVAGVALVRALDRCCAKENPRVSLKWPNDVLLDGAKLAGVLLETEDTAQGRAVVIGIGVNVAHAPSGLPYRAASLRSSGFAVSAEMLFAALSAEWLRALALWERGRGFATIRKAWLDRAAGLGEVVAVRSGANEAAGTFETIDPHGQLVVRVGSGAISTFSAGEVHFGEAGTIRPEAAA